MEIKSILPDTNFLILALSGREPYGSFIKKCIREKKLVFSAIVIAEFLTGATEEEEKIFYTLIKPFPILSVDLSIAQLAAFYRKKNLKLKKKLMLPDCLIAVTCKIYKVSLATLDKKDYPMEDIEFVKF